MLEGDRNRGSSPSKGTTPVEAHTDFDRDDAIDFEHHTTTHWELSVAPLYEILTGPNYDDIQFTNGPAVEGGLYYQAQRLLQIGVEGGYSFGHDNQDVLVTVDGIDFLLDKRLLVSRITPVIRLGEWLDGPWRRRWRPYVQVGAGWYELYEDESFKFV